MKAIKRATLHILLRALLPTVNNNRKKDTHFVRTIECICGERDSLTFECEDNVGAHVNVSVCTSCGLMRLSPYLDTDQLAEFYRKDYRKRYHSWDSQSKNKVFHAQRSTARKYIELLEHVRLKKGKKSNCKIIDLGCSLGGCVAELCEHGFDAEGVDLDDESVLYAVKNNLPVSQGDLTTLAGYKTYDVAILSHVIEHIPDIRRFVRALSELVSKDGVVVIATPLLFNWWSYLGERGDFKRHLQLPHCFYFRETDVVSLLNEQGFTPVVVNKKNNTFIFQRNQNWNRRTDINQSVYTLPLFLLALPFFKFLTTFILSIRRASKRA